MERSPRPAPTFQAAARLFKRLDCGSVLVVSQADSAISGVFDAVDTVVKGRDTASLQLMD